MIDLARVGKVTQWLKVAGMAEAFNLPGRAVILEIHAQLIAAILNGLTVEYMPWMLKPFQETPKLEKGHLTLSNAPGFGLKFDEAVVARYRAN